MENLIEKIEPNVKYINESIFLFFKQGFYIKQSYLKKGKTTNKELLKIK